MAEKKSIPIHDKIYEIRGQKVMLDSDLAMLYGVLTKNLNKAVKRNLSKFPSEFMFQLTKEEWNFLRSLFTTSKKDENELVPIWNQLENSKHRPTLPYVFTEHGVLMTANILNSENANKMSVDIIKVFVKLRNYINSQNGTNEQIAELRKLLLLYIEKNDKRVNEIMIALNNLIASPPKTKTIGFCIDKEQGSSA